jgi:hypothetical protein
MRVFEIKQKLRELGVKGFSKLNKAELEVLLETELEKLYQNETSENYKIQAIAINRDTEELVFNQKENSRLALHTFYEWFRTKKHFVKFCLYKNGRLINMKIRKPN